MLTNVTNVAVWKVMSDERQTYHVIIISITDAKVSKCTFVIENVRTQDRYRILNENLLKVSRNVI